MPRNDEMDETASDSGIEPKKKITFFHSFEEAEEHGLREMKSHSHRERLDNLEILRKRTYAHLLLPNGEWPPMKKIITIVKGTFNEPDK